MNKHLSDLGYEEIIELLKTFGQPSFRAKQLYEWIGKGCELNEMTNIPKSLIDRLERENYVSLGVKIIKTLVSEKDGTKKYLFSLLDGNVIEGVFMKYKYGNTLCVSTQVGCRMNCSFCASGLDGLVRNLSAGEILGQVLVVNKDNISKSGIRAVTNIVLMGSGEPLDNYDNVTKFLRLVSDGNGLNISKRNISLSTCGLCDKMYRLADEGFSPTMTISLHAPNDQIRKTIMPIANKYSIEDIINAVKYYFEATGRRIIFEYSMIEGVNDSESCAKELAKITKGLSCHVNLIGLNYVKEKGLKGSKIDRRTTFAKALEKLGVSCSLRRVMGDDIDGACGQLRRKFIKTNEVDYKD